MENPEPRSQYLNAVLRQIERTAFRIPRFQREFVWGQRDILDLLESIENGYPIGSILTWRVEGSDDYFSGFRTSPFRSRTAVWRHMKLCSTEHSVCRVSTVACAIRSHTLSIGSVITHELESSSMTRIRKRARCSCQWGRCSIVGNSSQFKADCRPRTTRTICYRLRFDSIRPSRSTKFR